MSVCDNARVRYVSSSCAAMRCAVLWCCRALLLPKGAAKTQVTRFWLRVLRSADAAALAISPRDAAVLSALADVRFSLDAGAQPSELQGKCEWWRARCVGFDSGRLCRPGSLLHSGCSQDQACWVGVLA